MSTTESEWVMELWSDYFSTQIQIQSQAFPFLAIIAHSGQSVLMGPSWPGQNVRAVP
jgi:hypothetical protein